MNVANLKSILTKAADYAEGRNVCVNMWIDEAIAGITHMGVYISGGPATLVIDRFQDEMRIDQVRSELDRMDDALEVEVNFKGNLYEIIFIRQFSVIPDVSIELKLKEVKYES